ncbi:DUF6707 family protein [Pseudarthrobacter sp. J75]|uniref:DUF6707 family protein n=1 Tax=unclassified Pseudarthrobacter TaxID=2647000 RepID=UPI002E805E64|nr:MULTISPECIES: DUF6707 family protein [unclassified Pseudarthrobacter]MEE2522546.1 DUF6707 family protein [Pseudarthrobacter sp. J47]MEE2529110.1 DUF6707 family protein [Pseudarthrobacter sp. J75]
MTQNPAEPLSRNQLAGTLGAGDRLVLPDASTSAEVLEIHVDADDYGNPALIVATLADGRTVRIAAASAVQVIQETHDAVTHLNPGSTAAGGTAGDPNASVEGHPGEDSAQAPAAVVVPPLPVAAPAAPGPSEEDLALIPEPSGTPESVVEAVAQNHQDSIGVLLLTDRLAKGINTKSGSCLKDLNDLAHELFVTLKDSEGALAVADILNVLPYDGNPGRWTSVEASLALSSYICRQDGQAERAAVYEKLLRTPESLETDPFKARMNAKVRQRSLNEPNLYDKEIFRSIDNSNHDAEREWRLLRLESLLFLRAHGGSETIGAGELERRIANELEAVRA